MTTINISLPRQLKSDAEALIELGHYVSFSDLVRDAIRNVIHKNRYDLMAEQTKKDLKTGKAIVLRHKKDIDEFMNSIK
jgi:Arc/MetJ-type ribon-helix-helix transcriptional regulator